MVLNRIHSRRPISRKKISSPKTREVENSAAFSPIFRHTGRALEGVFIVIIVIQVERENGVAALLGLYMTAYAVWMW